ncbi:DMT family transporter [Moraxella sp. ZJ142]|uniref:DMT family transporter n=1 Tax=Moraxella marmotae TaxID=3344520 RepID=UPI0035D486FD
MTNHPRTAHIDTGSTTGSLWMVVAAICFTIMGVLVKTTGVKFAMHEYELVFWRVLFATVVLGVQALMTGKQFTTRYWQAHFWRSLAGSVSLFMFFFGLVHLPLATAITFSYTSAIFLAIFSVIILRQVPSRLTWFALVLGLVGIVLILRPSILGQGLLPTAIGLASGAIAGYAYLQVRELSLLGEPSWRIVFYFSLLASVLAAVMSGIQGWTPIGLPMLPYLFGIGVSAMAGQLAMTHAYKVGRKFMVSALSYLVVVLSTLYGVVAFGEVLPLMALVGIVLVIASGVLAGKK